MIYENIIDLENWLLIIMGIDVIVLLILTIMGLIYQKRVNKSLTIVNVKQLYNPWPLQRHSLSVLLTLFFVLFSAWILAPVRTIETRTHWYEYETLTFDFIEEDDKLYIYKSLIQKNEDIPGYSVITEQVDDFEIKYYSSEKDESNTMNFIIIVTLLNEETENLKTFRSVLSRKGDDKFVGSGAGGSFFKSIMIIGETKEVFDMRIIFQFYEDKQGDSTYELQYDITIF